MDVKPRFPKRDTTIDLFEPPADARAPSPLLFERDSQTSFRAAVEIQPVAGTMRFAVLEYIRSRGEYGATDDEIEVALEMRHQTASARRRELELKNLVADSGEMRATRSGRKAAIWVAVTRKG